MTFMQLTYLVEISKCGSMNKAAQNLFLSQTGISTAVRSLEEELGIQFFTRSNRGIEFTTEGRQFVGYAVSLLEQKQRIESLYSGSSTKPASALFSVSTQRFVFIQSAFLEMFKTAQESHFSYTYREVGLETVIDDVYQHRSDLGFISISEITEGMLRHLLDLRNLEFHESVQAPPCVFCQTGHPLTRFSEVPESELLAYPYVHYEQELGTAVEFSEEYQILSLQRPARSVCTNSLSSVIDLITQTDAITVGSGLLSEHLLPGIVSIPIQNKAPIRLGWIINRHSKMSLQTERFIELMEASIQRSLQFTKQVQHREF